MLSYMFKDVSFYYIIMIILDANLISELIISTIN